MIILGHVIDELRKQPANSVQMFVTSIPYWSLRDYGLPPTIWGGDESCSHEFESSWKPRGMTGGTGHGRKKKDTHHAGGSSEFCTKCGAWRGQYGLEPTPELYVYHTVLVFNEVLRVLRPDGTLFLNIGDCYANDAKGPRGTTRSTLQSPDYQNECSPPGMQKGYRQSSLGIKRKDLVGIPWMVALALRSAGWYLRADCIWHKPTAMPMSVRDRPSTDHEYVFLLTKRAKYFYDCEAVKVEAAGTANPRGKGVNRKSRVPMGWDTSKSNHRQKRGRYQSKQNESWSEAVSGTVSHRNLRTVWRIPSVSFSGAHFATYPPRLVELCIKAGTSEKGCCPKCRAPWKRVTKKVRVPTRPGTKTKVAGRNSRFYQNRDAQHGSERKEDRYALEVGNRDPQRHVTTTETIGWRPSCGCNPDWADKLIVDDADCMFGAEEWSPVPCLVADPFLGSGTTGMMANYLGRAWWGIELQKDYVPIAEERIAAGYKPPKPRSKAKRLKKIVDKLQLELFK